MRVRKNHSGPDAGGGGSHPSDALRNGRATGPRPESGVGPVYRESELVTFDEMLTACNKAGVLVFGRVFMDPHDCSLRYAEGFYHRLGNGERHGPFKHEDQAYEDAFYTYGLWPW